ncbi:hypothetical protein [Streptomyces sp. 6N223]|uniref:hypothetical protein n=1 Tax=Streptomyces sp. 6N223 TaxID=3457412 RepID=UPI003FD3F3B6
MAAAVLSPDDEIPPYGDIDAFVGAIEALINEPPTRRGPSALIVLEDDGPEDAARPVLAGVRQRLLGRRWGHLPGPQGPGGGRLVAHAWVEMADRPAELPLPLLDGVADELRNMPRHTGALRLPRFALLRAAATASALPRDSEEERVRQLRRHLYEQRPRRGTVTPPEAEPPTAPWWWPLVWWLFGWCGPLLFAWRARRRMTGGRDAWFPEWVARRSRGEADRDFYVSAARLAPGGDLTAAAGEALLWALLADLDAALRRPRLSPWRARRTRFVIFAAGHTAPLIEAYRNATRELGSRGTVLLARAEAAPGDLQRASDFLNAASRLRDGDPPELSVLVPPPYQARDQAVRRALSYRPRIAPRRRWAWSPGVHAGLRACGVTLVLVGAVAGVVRILDVQLPPPFPSSSACGDWQFEGPDAGICVGLSDGRYFEGMPSAARKTFDMIAGTNEDVAALAEDGREVRTVVHLIQMGAEATTPDSEVPDMLAELRGVALAQRRVLEEAGSNDQRVALRVLVANAGRNHQFAEEVAHRITELSGEEGIIGVIGPSESREESYAALRVLGAASLPTVGTAATADQLREESALYYQLAPTNDRQALMASEFLAHEEIFSTLTGSGDEPDAPAEAAVVVYDPSDAYSQNLATDFARYFREHGEVELLRQGSPAGGSGDASWETFGALAEDVCARLRAEPATVVFWSGREDDLTAFHDSYSGHCPLPLTVLGGDTIASNLGLEINPLDEDSSLTMYYLAHAVPGLIEEPHGPVERFVEDYEREFNRIDTLGPEALYSGHAALGWDALYVLAEAAEGAYNGGSTPDFDRTAVVSEFDQVEIQGVTGWLNFEEDRMPQDKPVYILQAGQEEPEVVLQCGAFTDLDVQEEWGRDERHPCP